MKSIDAQLAHTLLLDRPIQALDVSIDCGLVATCVGSTVFVWRALDFSLVTQLNKRVGAKHKLPITSCKWSRNGEYIITCSEDHTVVVWNLASRRPILSYKTHTDTITDAMFIRWNNDNEYTGRSTHCITSSADGKVVIVNIRDAKSEPFILTNEAGVQALSTVPSFPSRLVCALSDGSIVMWDMEQSRKLVTLPGDSMWLASPHAGVGGASLGAWVDKQRFHTGSLTGVVLSPNGKYMLSSSEDNTAKMWNVLSFRKDQETVSTEVKNKRGSIVLIKNGGPQQVTPVDVGYTGKLLYTFRHDAEVTAVAFSRDSQLAISASRDCTVRVWHCETGRQVFHLNLSTPISSLVAVDAQFLTTEPAHPDDECTSVFYIATENRIVVVDVFRSNHEEVAGW